MTIRSATFSDHAALAEICGAAFFDEDLFGRVMHPRRDQYPNGPALYWHKHIREEWIDWRNHFFVKVVKDEKTGKERIVGVAVWQRQGEGGKRFMLNALDPREYFSSGRAELSKSLGVYFHSPFVSLHASKHIFSSSGVTSYFYHFLALSISDRQLRRRGCPPIFHFSHYHTQSLSHRCLHIPQAHDPAYGYRLISIPSLIPTFRQTRHPAHPLHQLPQLPPLPQPRLGPHKSKPPPLCSPVLRAPLVWPTCRELVSVTARGRPSPPGSRLWSRARGMGN